MAAIVGSKLIGAFKVLSGVKMTAVTDTEFQERNQKQLLNFSKAKDLIRSHDSTRSRLLEKLSYSLNGPNLNAKENLWAIVKAKLHAGRRQCNNNNDLWDSIEIDCSKVERETIGSLTKSMDMRVVTITNHQLIGIKIIILIKLSLKTLLFRTC